MDVYETYLVFLKDFCDTINQNDPLSVRVPGYNVSVNEVIGEIIDITYTHISNCPPSLLVAVAKEVVKDVLQKCKDTPKDCGYDEDMHVYKPIKLMQQVVMSINDTCKTFLDNSRLCSIVPLALPRFVTRSVKNRRRTMEDRLICIDDFNLLFELQDTEPTSFYAIFDGHAGKDAASYSVAHLHHNLAKSSKYPTNITIAMQEAFLKTDLAFIEKSKRENLHSGTTCVCCLYRKNEQKLWVGWVGDSQAMVVKEGKLCQIVRPHTCESEAERLRITKAGGSVMSWNGQYRVNGQLLVSRAIGDANFKPYVSAEPEIECIPLDGKEDFLILACDGLWDHVNPDDIAIAVYNFLKINDDNIENIAKHLVELAVKQNSSDNISIIVVFLKEPHLITKDWTSSIYKTSMDTMESAFEENSATLKNNSDNQFQTMKTIDELENEINLKPSVDMTNDMIFSNAHENNSNEHEQSDLCTFAETKAEHELHQEQYETQTITTTSVEKDVDTLMQTEIDGNVIGSCFNSSSAENVNVLENKILEELTLHNPDMLANPFAEDSDKIFTSEAVEIDNKMNADMEELKSDMDAFESIPTDNSKIHKLDSTEKRDVSFEKETGATNGVADFLPDNEDGETGCDNRENAGGIDIGVDSGAEESEDEEWNYIEVKKDNQKGSFGSTDILEPSSALNNLDTYMDQEQEKILVDREIEKVEQNLFENLIGKEDANKKELKIDCSSELDDNMASQLNPDAKEFVPLSPQRSTPTNPFAPGLTAGLLLDDVIAQSPRKGALMEDIRVPPENEFDFEISKCPHELEETSVDEVVVSNGDSHERPCSASSNNGNSSCTYQELNLKEAMQGDEKLEGEYNDETDKVVIDTKEICEIDAETMEKQFKEDDPMNKSFYEGISDDCILSATNNFDDLNKVQLLPSSEEVEENGFDGPDENKENVHIEKPIIAQETGDLGMEITEPTENNIIAFVTDLEPQVDTEAKNTEPIAAIYAATQELTNNFSNLLMDATNEVANQTTVTEPIELSKDIWTAETKEVDLVSVEVPLSFDQKCEDIQQDVTEFKDEQILIPTEEPAAVTVEEIKSDQCAMPEFELMSDFTSVPEPNLLLPSLELCADKVMEEAVVEPPAPEETVVEPSAPEQPSAPIAEVPIVPVENNVVVDENKAEVASVVAAAAAIGTAVAAAGAVATKKPTKPVSTATKAKPSESKKIEPKVSTVTAAKPAVKKLTATTAATAKPAAKSPVAAKPTLASRSTVAPRPATTVPSATKSVGVKKTTTSTITQTSSKTADIKKAAVPVKSAPAPIRKPTTATQATKTTSLSSAARPLSSVARTTTTATAKAGTTDITSRTTTLKPTLSSKTSTTTTAAATKSAPISRSPLKPRTVAPAAAPKTATAGGTLSDTKPKATPAPRSALASTKSKDIKTTGASTVTKSTMHSAPPKLTSTAKKPIANTRTTKAPTSTSPQKPAPVDRSKNMKIKSVTTETTETITNGDNAINGQTTVTTNTTTLDNGHKLETNGDNAEEMIMTTQTQMIVIDSAAD